MSKNEYDFNEETFTLLGEPTAPIVEDKPVIQRHQLRQSTWSTVMEIVVLVLILLFGVGVMVSNGDWNERENTVSVEE